MVHPVLRGWLSAQGWYWQKGPGRIRLGDKLPPRKAYEIFTGYPATGERRISRPGTGPGLTPGGPPAATATASAGCSPRASRSRLGGGRSLA